MARRHGTAIELDAPGLPDALYERIMQKFHGGEKKTFHEAGYFLASRGNMGAGSINAYTNALPDSPEVRKFMARWNEILNEEDIT